MANDFTGMSAGLDALANEVAAVVAELQNPATDNNDQATIDALTARLNSSVTALKAAADAAAPVAPAAPTAPADAPAATDSAPADATAAPTA